MTGNHERSQSASRPAGLDRWFSAPAFDDPETDRRARQLNAILWTLVGTALLMFSLSFAQPHMYVPGLIAIYGALIINLSLSIAILRSRRVRASAFCLSTMLWTIITFAAWNYGGLASQIPSTYIVLVLIVSMTLGSRWGIGFAALSACTVVFLGLAGTEGWLPPPPHERSDLDHWPPVAAGLIVSAALIHITLQNLTSALDRAHANELAHRRGLEDLRASQATAELRASQGAAIGGLGQELLEARSREELAELTLSILAERLGASQVSVFETDSSSKRVRRMAQRTETGKSVESPWIALEPKAATALDHVNAVTHLRGDEASGLPCCGNVDWALLAPIPGRLDVHGLVCAGFHGEKPGDAEAVFLATAVGVLASAMEREQADQRVRQAQRLEAVGQLAGGIAHDFNNLLTAILACSELLLRRLPEGSDESSLVGDIKASGERAALLTQQLLAFSRRDVVISGATDVGTVVSGLESILRRLLGEHIQIATEIDEGLPEVRADRANVEQIVMNLCVNARDAMPSGGDLRINVHEVGLAQLPDGLALSERRYVRIEVEDTGEGIAPEHRVRIFEPFFSTKEHGRGTGLGLSTVFGIARGVGGTVQVESEVGQGTTFTVYLPVRSDDSISMPPTFSIADGEGDGDGGSERILLVEDNHLVRRATEAVLESAGYEVVSAANGFDALEILERTQVALILTDLRMPRMGGLALARQVEGRGESPPILFMSGYAADIDELPSRIRHNLIRKPYKSGDLLRRIRAGLDTRRSRDSERPRADD